MSRYANKITVAALGTIVREDGCLLLLQRQKDPFIGKWALPGGKLEFAEHPSEAVVREFREETGLTVKVSRFCGTISEQVREGGEVSHFIMHLFRLDFVSGTVLEEATEEGPLQWVRPEELPERMIPSDLWMIQNLLLSNSTPSLVEMTSTPTESVLAAQFS